MINLIKKDPNELTNLIKESAGLESLDWINSNNELPPSATVVVQDLKILIPLEGLIDPMKAKD